MRVVGTILPYPYLINREGANANIVTDIVVVSGSLSRLLVRDVLMGRRSVHY